MRPQGNTLSGMARAMGMQPGGNVYGKLARWRIYPVWRCMHGTKDEVVYLYTDAAKRKAMRLRRKELNARTYRELFKGEVTA